jgi:6-phosphogluconolactonase
MRLFITLLALCSVIANAGSVVAWIGTSAGGSGNALGIYRTEMDLSSGKLTEPTLAAEVGSPGFLAMHPNGRVLYAACQLSDGQGGGIAAFAIDETSSSLSLINTQPTGDGGAAHLTVDHSGRLLFSGQYGGGSVAAFPLNEDGTIGDRSQLVEHEGSGPNKSRQEGPHPHWVGVDPTNEFLMVPDLGVDRVVIYRIDHEKARISRHGEGVCPTGGGPRHFKFHPCGKWAYVVNELIMAVTVFEYDSAEGTLNSIQTIPALPEYYREGFNSSSEIRLHPSGRFVYTANRGHDSITVFAVSAETGRLRFVEREAIRGAMPRNFNLDPSGEWLIAAGKDSNTLSSFIVNQDSGGLLFSRHLATCPTPMCVVFQQTK